MQILRKSTPFICALAFASGCGSVSREEFDSLQRLNVSLAYARRDYKLQPGDVVKITVFRAAEFPQEYNQQIAVQPDGRLHLVGVDKPIRAEGLTVTELNANIHQAYSSVFDRPGAQQGERAWFVTAQFMTSEKAAWLPDQVFVTGQVRRAGAVPYRRGITMLQAIASTGGWLVTANDWRVVLLRMNSEGRTVTREVDLTQIVGHYESDVELFPGDVVYVPLSFIAQLNVWIDLYVRGLLPFNPSIIRSFLLFGDTFQ